MIVPGIHRVSDAWVNDLILQRFNTALKCSGLDGVEIQPHFSANAGTRRAAIVSCAVARCAASEDW